MPVSASAFALLERRRERRRARPASRCAARGRAASTRVPDVEHAPALVEGLQTLDRPAVVAELAVVVVLEHERAAALRPREEREPPRERQHAAGRELVRRRDEGEPRSGGRALERARRRARRRRPARAGSRRRAPRRREREAGVVRLLERDAVARVDQHARDEVDRLLRAVARRGPAPARSATPRARAQVAGERRAQLGRAARRAVGELRGARAPARAAPSEPPPGLERQVAERGLAVAEVVRQRRRGTPHTRSRGTAATCARARSAQARGPRAAGARSRAVAAARCRAAHLHASSGRISAT